MRDFLRRGTRGTQSGSIEKLPLCLFLEGNTGNTVAEINIFSGFLSFSGEEPGEHRGALIVT